MPRTNGTMGMKCLIGLLQTSALIIGCVIVHNIDAKTQVNSRMIAVHSDRLSEHENNFQQIYLGTFTRDFAHEITKELSNGR